MSAALKPSLHALLDRVRWHARGHVHYNIAEKLFATLWYAFPALKNVARRKLRFSTVTTPIQRSLCSSISYVEAYGAHAIREMPVEQAV